MGRGDRLVPDDSFWIADAAGVSLARLCPALPLYSRLSPLGFTLKLDEGGDERK